MQFLIMLSEANSDPMAIIFRVLQEKWVSMENQV